MRFLRFNRLIYLHVTFKMFRLLNLKSSPDICGEVNLITLLISEDEGSHRHVINVLSDPVHLGHHLVHFVGVFTLNGKCYL